MIRSPKEKFCGKIIAYIDDLRPGSWHLDWKCIRGFGLSLIALMIIEIESSFVFSCSLATTVWIICIMTYDNLKLA